MYPFTGGLVVNNEPDGWKYITREPRRVQEGAMTGKTGDVEVYRVYLLACEASEHGYTVFFMNYGGAIGQVSCHVSERCPLVFQNAVLGAPMDLFEPPKVRGPGPLLWYAMVP